jgi:signal transduction histidine kinase/ActR/RegA family two-component response regulator
VSTGEDYALRGQLTANYRGLPAALVPAPLNAAIIAWPLLGHVANAKLGLWVALILAQALTGLGLRAWYLKQPLSRPLEQWLNLRVLHAGFGGLVWGGYAAWQLWVPQQVQLQLYVLLIVSLTSAGALVSTGVLFRAFCAYVIPCILPAIVRFASVPDRPHLASALELSVLLAVLLVGGLMMSRSARAQFSLRERNEGLIQELRHAEEELKNANRSLEQHVEERTQALARAVEEKHHSELQLVRAQKMEAIGRLAGGVAHDFNNILTAIKGSADFLLEGLPEEASEAREELEQILRSSDRAARLTGQLLSFTRGRVGQPRPLDATEQLRQLGHLLRRAAGEAHRVEMVIDDDPLVIWMDPSQFDQLVMNLVLNARDASASGTNILICLERKLSGAAAAGRKEVASLLVKDEGSGMSPDIVERIFEPFFSTKGERGTGLGLATCFGIVQRAEGRISVRSEPGQGSCFSVELPLLQAPVSIAAPKRPSARDAMALRSVLIVEDQEPVLRVVVKAISAMGARVHEARSAEEAQALFARGIPDLDLIISDVLLPRQSGPELLRQLEAEGFAGACLLISGYVEDEVIMDPTTGERIALLQKPFSVSELEDAVARVLAASMERWKARRSAGTLN